MVALVRNHPFLYETILKNRKTLDNENIELRKNVKYAVILFSKDGKT